MSEKEKRFQCNPSGCRLYSLAVVGIVEWHGFVATRYNIQIFGFFLKRIMQVKPRREVIEALLSIWDPTNNVFCLTSFEMTPTLEEKGGFTGFGVRLYYQRLIAPRRNTWTFANPRSNHSTKVGCHYNFCMIGMERRKDSRNFERNSTIRNVLKRVKSIDFLILWFLYLE